MITSIGLNNFKCFRTLKLSLGRLTVLTGFNAAGKSTTLQSLLLISQTVRTNDRSSELRLNGPLVHLGSPADVINQEQPEQPSADLKLGLTTENADLLWSMKIDDRDERRVLRVITVRMGGSGPELPLDTSCSKLLPSTATISDHAAIEDIRQTIYVSAVRQVETDVFPIPEESDPIYVDVGAFGEYAPWWFHALDDIEVEPERCLEGVDNPRTLRAQVNAWLGELFPGAEANAQPLPNTQLMRLELRTGKN